MAVHPRKNNRHMSVIRLGERRCAFENTSENFSDHIPCAPRWVISRSIPTAKKKSPTRLVINAFLPATAFARSENQKDISRYEQTPTPSHPRNISRKLSARTSVIIENIKRLR